MRVYFTRKATAGWDWVEFGSPYIHPNLVTAHDDRSENIRAVKGATPGWTRQIFVYILFLQNVKKRGYRL
jgi:hypothetical protein